MKGKKKLNALFHTEIQQVRNVKRQVADAHNFRPSGQWLVVAGQE